MKEKEKKTRFGDLEPGDIIWRENYKDWQLDPIKVIRVEEKPENISYIRVALSNGSNFLVFAGDWHYDLLHVWSDKREAVNYMNERATKMELQYIKEIDELISKYDNLQRWKRNLEI